MPRFSIIVPIYQVEAYLEACLESIRAQDFEDFEVICVVDGATDGSEEIARRFAEQDARFLVFAKENGGLSSARNFGIERARGDIVLFVDSDDQIAPECCRRVSEAFEATGTQVLVFGMEIASDEPVSDWYDRVCSPPEGVFDGASPAFAFVEYATPYAVRDAISRDLLIQAGLRFDEDSRFAEDVVFQFALYPQARRIATIPDKLYRYKLDNPASLSHAHLSDVKRLTAHLDVMNRVFAEWRELGLLGAYGPRLLSWSRAYAFYGLENLSREERASHLMAVGEIWRSFFGPDVVDGLSGEAPAPELLLMRALLTEGAASAEIERACKYHIWGLQFNALPEGERHPARLVNSLLCRGDGKLYLECHVQADRSFSTLDGVAFADGVPVPIGVYPLSDDSGEAGDRASDVVVEAPLLDASTLEVSIRPDGDISQQATVSIGYRKARWLSRLNYRIRKDQCARIRDFERPFVYGRYQLSVTNRFAKGEDTVWRFAVTWVGDPERMPELRFADSRGLPLGARCHFMEFQPRSEHDPLGRNIAYFSVELPGNRDHFIISAHDFRDDGCEWDGVGVRLSAAGRVGVAARGDVGDLDEREESLTRSALAERDESSERDRGASGRIMSGFTVVDPPAADVLSQQARELMKSAGDDDELYRSWFAAHQADAATLGAQRVTRIADAPFFSIVIMWDGGNDQMLEETMRSIEVQSFAGWEVVVACVRVEDASRCASLLPENDRWKALPVGGESPDSNAAHAGDDRVASLAMLLADKASDESSPRLKGDLVGFVSCGDTLEPDALYECARASSRPCGHVGGSTSDVTCSDSFADFALPDVLYSDEDVRGESGLLGQPFFKSRLNVDLLYCGNWVGNFLVMRRSLLKTMGQEALAEVFAGPSWQYDLALRAYECSSSFEYVPHVLYHARACPLFVREGVLLEAHKQALDRHLRRRGIVADVVAADVAGALRVRYALPTPRPLVSIIVPSKDHVDLLDTCVRSIAERATYDSYEILIVENNSSDPKTFEYYERVSKEFPRARVVRWEHEFNYSKIINFGVEHARGDYYLFLNNDTEIVEPSFIEEMVGCLQRPEVGVVGARLLFRDGLLQNAGSGVGIWDAVVCFNQNRAMDDGGYLEKARLPGNFTAVGGACQMTRASTFRELGGYDESLAVAFNDIDYCMRAGEAGYLSTYTPYATVLHYEFASRGREEFDEGKLRRWHQERGLFMRKHPEPFASGDLYTSPNLVRHNTYYRL